MYQIISSTVLYYFFNYIAPTTVITFNPSSPITGAMVGIPQNISCIVNTTVPEVSSVNVSWTGPGRVSITNITNRVTISPITSSGNIFNSSLQFDYLMEGDEGNYTCNVMILETSANQSIELQLLTGKYFVSYKLEMNTHSYLSESCCFCFTKD